MNKVKCRTKGEQAFDEVNRLRVGGNCVYRLVDDISDYEE